MKREGFGLTGQEVNRDPLLIKTFRGHKDRVNALSIHPNLKQIVTASDDNSLLVWNTAKAETRPFKFLGHKGPVMDCAFSPNGTVIASGSKDETIRFWENTVEGRNIMVKAHVGTVRSVQFSSDGRLLVSASDDKTVKIWTANEKRFQFSLAGHTNWVRSACFSPDIRLVSSCGDDHTVRLWDLESKKELHVFDEHKGVVYSCKFHPDGTLIASAGHDKKIKIWDIRSKRLIQHYDAHADAVNQICFHPSGNFLLSASEDAKVKGRLAYTLYGHEGSSLACSFSFQGDYFATGGADHTLMLWKSNFENSGLEHIEERPQTASAKPSGNTAKSGLQGSKSGVIPMGASAVTRPKEMTFSPQRRAEEERKESYQVTGPSQAVPKIKTAYDYLYSDKDSSLKLIHEQQAHQTGPIKETETQKHMSPLRGKPAEVPQEISQTLQKIAGQLDLMNKTLQVFEMRIANNEEQIAQILSMVSEDLRQGVGFH